MSQYINLVRFGRLLRKHLAEHLAGYALSAAVALGGLLAVMALLSYWSRFSGGFVPGEQAALYMLTLVGAGSFFTSTVLAGYGQGSRAALGLTLPASHLEKYLVAWLVSVPGFLVAFTGIFYLADWVVLALTRQTKLLVNLFDNQEAVVWVLLLFLLLHALALWGSIFFRRQQFVRTGFVVFAAVVLLCLANYEALKLLIGPAMDGGVPFSNVNLDNGLHLSLPESQTKWLGWLPVALILLLWPAAYARLAEKQL